MLMIVLVMSKREYKYKYTFLFPLFTKWLYNFNLDTREYIKGIEFSNRNSKRAKRLLYGPNYIQSGSDATRPLMLSFSLI